VAAPASSRYHARPGLQIASTTVKYHQFGGDATLTLDRIAKLTPRPKGHERFSTIEVIHTGGPIAERLLAAPRIDAACPVRFYELPETHLDPTEEFRAIFELEEAMMLQRANRQSLIVWIGRPDRPELDGFAGFLGMLPFRGVTVALVTGQRAAYPDPFYYRTPSGVIEHDATDPVRMGKCCVHAVFGPLPSRTFVSTLGEWSPIDITPLPHEPMKRLPFKIAGLSLPMITYTGDYDSGVEELATRVASAYTPAGLFPIVSCGEVVDRIGYGLDILRALERRGFHGYYFTHASGETHKRWAEYGRPELLGRVAAAKEAGQTVLFLAVGGGCNGNATGVVAAMTNSHFIEVPTTPLHYNDATTSAKKAFSLVKEGRILSKNLLGTFFLPKLVFCINETLLTSSSASIHSTVGECTKTMNMIAMADSRAGQADYADILGAHEFASDTTRILECVDGFEHLIAFVQDAQTRQAKQAVLDLGARIADQRATAEVTARALSGRAAAAVAQAAEAEVEVAALVAERRTLLRAFRGRYYTLPEQTREAIDEFLTVSNLEIVGAKAMFLAYEDPFEKYRALLFEYAHTLGHAVEAWLAGVLERAKAVGLPPAQIEAATRNHGQCVGMAVLWAGHISRELGALTGDGFVCHQGMVYLFNSFGGFSFAPVRALCDALGIQKAEFLRECIAGVRLDNKRGYCECAIDVSVDQLVTSRPGRMLRSADANAEVRYMVIIEEARQRQALERAFDLEFDLVAHRNPATGALEFLPLATDPRAAGLGRPIAAELRRRIRAACEADAAELAAADARAELATSATKPSVRICVASSGTASPASTASSAERWSHLAAEGYSTSSEGDTDSDDVISRSTTYAELAGSTSPYAHHARVARAKKAADAADEATAADSEEGETSSARFSSSEELRAAMAGLHDFSPSVPEEYRLGYQRWRAGKPCGAKGEARRPRASTEEQLAITAWEDFLASAAGADAAAW